LPASGDLNIAAEKMRKTIIPVVEMFEFLPITIILFKQLRALIFRSLVLFIAVRCVEACLTGFRVAAGRSRICWDLKSIINGVKTLLLLDISYLIASRVRQIVYSNIRLMIGRYYVQKLMKLLLITIWKGNAKLCFN